METEHPAAPRFRIKPVGEARLDTGALVQEWERSDWCWNVLRKSGAIFLRLSLDARKRGAARFGLDYALGLPIDVEQVVRGAAAYSVSIGLRPWQSGSIPRWWLPKRRCPRPLNQMRDTRQGPRSDADCRICRPSTLPGSGPPR